MCVCVCPCTFVCVCVCVHTCPYVSTPMFFYVSGGRHTEALWPRALISHRLCGEPFLHTDNMRAENDRNSRLLLFFD